jgi:prophage tail gpP-like protein
MTDQVHQVQLTVNSTHWLGWKKINITRSIDRVANSFSLSLTDAWSADQQRRAINEGDNCRVAIDGATVITGFIDDANPSYDAKTHSIDVIGRDATGDLVDCSAPSFQWQGRSLLSGVELLCEPFGINVTTDLNEAKTPFKSLKSDEAETVFEVIENAARIRAALLMANGNGGLLITRPGTRRFSGRLELGVNIKSAREARSRRDRFSSYTVKGQTADAWTDTASVSAKATDKAVSRYRPKIILANDAVDLAACQRLANWHRNIAAAKSHAVTYEIQGWYLDGKLLEPNYLVRVKDTYLNINRDMLIVTVRYLLDEQGLRAELDLALPEAYQLTELPEPNDDGGVF